MVGEVRLLIQGIAALAMVADAACGIVFANQQVMDYQDCAPDELRGWLTNPRIVHPDDLGRARQIVADALALAAPVHGEYRLLRRDGDYRWFEARLSPVRAASGEITHWFVLLIDIDDRRRSDEQARQNEAFLAEGQRLSETGSFRWRLAADEIIWSDQTYRIFEIEPGTKLTRELITGNIHPDDVPLAEASTAAALRGEDFEFPHRAVMKDGSVKHVYMVAHAIRGADGEVEYVGAIQDVTRRWLAEDGLTRARSELAHVGRVMSLGALSASIAHEVSQPLSGIVTNASTNLRVLATDPPNLEIARESAKRMLRDANRAADVVARLRALFSKQETPVGLVDLNEAAREILSLSANQLSRSRVIARSAFDPHLPPVEGDKVQLQQVILNLVLNASEAMQGQGGEPYDLVVATARDDAGRVVLSVRDVGPGVDPNEVEKLFEAFHTTKAGGMGIGLSISRSIIEAHRGRLWVEQHEGPGATFAFALDPAAPLRASDQGSGEKAHASRPPA